MRYAFSKHALEQMEVRSIHRGWVEKVMENPEQILNQGDLTVYQGKLAYQGSEYLLRIFINRSVEPALIVTVYKTSKFGKYYENKI